MIRHNGTLMSRSSAKIPQKENHERKRDKTKNDRVFTEAKKR